MRNGSAQIKVAWPRIIWFLGVKQVGGSENRAVGPTFTGCLEGYSRKKLLPGKAGAKRLFSTVISERGK
jgi:hypothetical protein